MWDNMHTHMLNCYILPPHLPLISTHIQLTSLPVVTWIHSLKPASPRSIDPLDYTTLCYSVPNSTLVVNEDQVVDGVGVVQPTCTTIHDECVRESKEEPTVKDDSLPAAPHSLHPDIPCDSATVDFPCENSFLDVSTFDRSQDTLDVNLSLHVERTHIPLKVHPICHVSFLKT